MLNKLILVSVGLVFLFSCSLSTDAQIKRSRTPVRRAVKPKPVLATGAVKTPSGLIYLVTQKGTGRLPKTGETVVVHYTGTLTNGIKFDSSRDRSQPFEFPLGQGRVIKGWDEGIAKLRIGDQAIFVIPPTLGYGSRGAGNGVIPPDATLIFIVELVDIKPGYPVETSP